MTNELRRARWRTKTRRGRRRGYRAASLALLALGCLVPGETYRVAPEVEGRFRAWPADASSLRLTVTHRENPQLFEVQTKPLGEDGRFDFGPAELAISGREYSKFYRAWLHLREPRGDRVVWRAEFSRNELAGPIELDCDLTRSPRIGQPCQVVEPTRHVWLVARGRETFRRLCAECHGDPTDPGDREAAATAAGVTPPDLTRIAERRAGVFDRDEIAEWIEGTRSPAAHGNRTMPIWGERLSEDFARYGNTAELVGSTIDPVVVYLESLQRTRGQAPDRSPQGLEAVP